VDDNDAIQRRRWIFMILLLAVSLILLIYIWNQDLKVLGYFPWLTIASLLPALFVLNHGMFLQWQPQTLSINQTADERHNLTVQRLKRLISQEYGGWAISINYYLPTFALAITGIVTALAMYSPQAAIDHVSQILNLGDTPISDSLIGGIRFGALGAYVYVLMTIGERTFRRDISPGLAQWSAAQLVLGPILGGTLASTLESTTQLSDFTQQILFFVAGMAPRQIVAVLSDTATRFWTKADPIVINTISLRLIGGITPRVEERLFEEGIEDAHQLAMANPIRLNRDMPYELRQITNWIDQAILFSTIPDSAALLQKEGITGSMDLASYYPMLRKEPTDDSVEESSTADREPQTRIDKLAAVAHLDKDSLCEVIRRLHEDRQVVLVMTLYQADQVTNDETAGNNGGR
jgi:predicted flap endonuclease-1-like 5' DNA nuclease